jgi:cardiolipin synthase
MFHCKVLVVDGLWYLGGSTNFDSRSFRLNDEANLNVYDREFAQRQLADFESDLKQRAPHHATRNGPTARSTESRGSTSSALFGSQM